MKNNIGPREQIRIASQQNRLLFQNYKTCYVQETLMVTDTPYLKTHSRGETLVHVVAFNKKNLCTCNTFTVTNITMFNQMRYQEIDGIQKSMFNQMRS